MKTIFTSGKYGDLFYIPVHLAEVTGLSFKHFWQGFQDDYRTLCSITSFSKYKIY